jgi:hypothetical protein
MENKVLEFKKKEPEENQMATAAPQNKGLNNAEIKNRKRREQEQRNKDNRDIIARFNLNKKSTGSGGTGGGSGGTPGGTTPTRA